MIDPTDVADAALARAVAAIAGAFPVTDTSAPAGDHPSKYVVLEWPAGKTRSGSLGAPEQHLTLPVRVRGVGRSSSPAAARKLAQGAAHAVTAALLDRSVAITGSGWIVAGRRELSDAGTDLVGELANSVVDLEFEVVPA